MRPEAGHSADGWRAVLEPVISRYQGIVKRLYFRGDAQPLCPGADAEAGLVQVLDRGCRDGLAHGLSEALKAAGASLADPAMADRTPKRSASSAARRFSGSN